MYDKINNKGNWEISLFEVFHICKQDAATEVIKQKYDIIYFTAIEEKSNNKDFNKTIQNKNICYL